MTKLTLHAFTGTNDGTVSADFRGHLFIGDKEGDRHYTIKEVDFADDDPEILLLMPLCVEANKLFTRMEGVITDPLNQVLGGHSGLRLGIWDKVAPE